MDGLRKVTELETQITIAIDDLPFWYIRNKVKFDRIIRKINILMVNFREL